LNCEDHHQHIKNGARPGKRAESPLRTPLAKPLALAKGHRNNTGLDRIGDYRGKPIRTSHPGHGCGKQPSSQFASYPFAASLEAGTIIASREHRLVSPGKDPDNCHRLRVD
jgi:hypothetical protein